MAEFDVAEGLVSSLAARASRADLALCHWKSNVRLRSSVIGRTDLDFSIPPEQEERLRKILLELAFLPFLSPKWAYYEGVSDWLGHDPGSGTLLHVHLHTRLLTGSKSVKEQDLPWLDLMNGALRQHADTGLLIPEAAFEYHLLLAREAIKSRSLRGTVIRLLGRSSLDVATCEELHWLWEQATSESVDHWGEVLWTKAQWLQIRSSVQYPQICQSDANFRALAETLCNILLPWRNGTAVGNSFRFLSMRFFQMAVTRWERTFRRNQPNKRLLAARAPVVAFVGSDGAGKTTVASDIERWLGWKAEVVTLYFGANEGWYRKLRALRAVFKRRSLKSLNKARSPTTETIPAWLKALFGVLLARKRLNQQRRAFRMARRSVIVLADRWPQNQVFGSCDGPSASADESTGWVVRALRKYEYRLFQRMAKSPPDLLIKLNVSLEVATKRKPDHPPEMLARKIEILGALSFVGTPTVEVDATQPFDKVTMGVRAHVWGAMRRVWKAGHAVY